MPITHTFISLCRLGRDRVGSTRACSYDVCRRPVGVAVIQPHHIWRWFAGAGTENAVEARASAHGPADQQSTHFKCLLALKYEPLYAVGLCYRQPDRERTHSTCWVVNCSKLLKAPHSSPARVRTHTPDAIKCRGRDCICIAFRTPFPFACAARRR